MLFFTFRSFHGLLLCLATVSVATVWAAAVFALMGRPVDIIGSVIPTTILVYGVVDPIFVLTRVLHKLEAGRGKHDAIVEALSELALPCFVTSLTTAFGFAVFVTARALTIRYYGLSVAAGVLFAWLTSVTVLPLLLSIAPLPKRRFSTHALTRRVDATLAALWGWLRHRVPQAIALTLVALLGSAFFARKQEVDNVYVGALPHGQILRDTRASEQKLTGVLRVIVYLEGPADAMKQPAVLKAIEKVDATMERQRLVTLSSSLADLVGAANHAFQGDVRERRVPESPRLIAQYLALVDPGDRADFVTDDYSRSHIALLLEDAGSKATREVVAALERAIAEAGFDALGVKASLTGNGVVGYGELDSVVTDLLYGFVIAFAVIVLVQWIAFRSLRIALISIVPNLLPVIACFLALRAAGVDLRIDSAIMLCISIGGLFNTTIHFAARVRQRLRETRETPDEVILHAMRAIGPPALFTAATLSAGFAVLLLSRFPGLQQLGLLSMITLLSGVVSDMTVTAALMRAGLDWKAAPSNATQLTAAATPEWRERP
jgi:predicted RND superfamily exporter protein